MIVLNVVLGLLINWHVYYCFQGKTDFALLKLFKGSKTEALKQKGSNIFQQISLKASD